MDHQVLQEKAPTFVAIHVKSRYFLCLVHRLKLAICCVMLKISMHIYCSYKCGYVVSYSNILWVLQ